MLHVVPNLSLTAGGPRNALPLVRFLTRHGVDTLLLTTNRDGEGRLDVDVDNPVVVEGVTCIFHNVTRLGGRWDVAPSLPATLRRVVGDFDLVHIHWLYGFPSLAAARAAIAADKPFVMEPHGSLDPHLFKKNRLVKRVYLDTVGRPLLARAAAMLFTAEQERRLASYRPRRPEWVVPVGLDMALYEPLPPRGAFRAAFPDIDGPYLLFLGRLSPQKGLDLLIPAFARLVKARPGLRLVLAGPDYRGYERDVRQMARDCDVEQRISLTGLLTHELKVAAMVDAELFVLPSYAENFGAVIIEALACGLPVVISDQVGIHREMAAAGLATVVACSVDSVAAGIEAAMGDEELRRRIAVRGPAVVREQYTWDAIVPVLIEKYKGVIES